MDEHVLTRLLDGGLVLDGAVTARAVLPAARRSGGACRGPSCAATWPAPPRSPFYREPLLPGGDRPGRGARTGRPGRPAASPAKSDLDARERRLPGRPARRGRGRLPDLGDDRPAGGHAADGGPTWSGWPTTRRSPSAPPASTPASGCSSVRPRRPLLHGRAGLLPGADGASGRRPSGAAPAPSPLLAELVLRHRPTAMVGRPHADAAVAEAPRGARGADPPTIGRRADRLHRRAGAPRGPVALRRSGERLATLWGAAVLGTYASTEMATVVRRLHARDGRPPPPRPDGGRDRRRRRAAPCPPGEPGEVVATPAAGQRHAAGALSHRGHGATLHAEPCPCGRTTPAAGAGDRPQEPDAQDQGDHRLPAGDLRRRCRRSPGCRGYYRRGARHLRALRPRHRDGRRRRTAR